MMRLQPLDLEDGGRIINVCFRDEDDLLRFLRVWKMLKAAETKINEQQAFGG